MHPLMGLDLEDFDARLERGSRANPKKPGSQIVGDDVREALDELLGYAALKAATRRAAGAAEPRSLPGELFDK